MLLTLLDLFVFYVNQLGGYESADSELAWIFRENFRHTVVCQNALLKLFNYLLKTKYIVGLNDVGFELNLAFGGVELPLVIADGVLIYFLNFNHGLDF